MPLANSKLLMAATTGGQRFHALVEAIVAFFTEDPNRARLLLREMLDRPEALRDLFAELHKLRSDLKKEQRVKEHREQECAEAEKALDDASPSNPNPNPNPDPDPNPNPIPIPIPNPSPNRNPNPKPDQALDDAREQVKEQAASLELCEKRRQNAGPEERRRL